MVNEAKIIIKRLKDQTFSLATIKANLAKLELNCDSKLLNQVFKNIKQNLLRVLESLDKIIILNPEKTNSFREINDFCNSIQAQFSKARIEMHKHNPESAIPDDTRSLNACLSLANHYEDLAKNYLDILEPYHQDIGRLDNPEVKLYEPNLTYDISKHRDLLINTFSYLGTEYYEKYFLFMNSRKIDHQEASILKLYALILNSFIEILNPQITAINQELEKPLVKDSSLDDLIKKINKILAVDYRSIDQKSLVQSLRNKDAYSNLIKDLREAAQKNKKIRVQDFTKVVLILNELRLQADTENHFQLKTNDILSLRQMTENDTRNQDGYSVLENIYRKTLYILEPFNHMVGLIYVHGNSPLSDEARTLTQDSDVKISIYLLKEEASKISKLPLLINPQSEISKIMNSKYKIIFIKSGIEINDLQDLYLAFDNQKLKELITKIYSTALAQNSINLKQAAELIYILAEGLKKEQKSNGWLGSFNNFLGTDQGPSDI